MRVCFLNPIGNIGGAERVLLTAVTELQRVQPDICIRVICLSDGPLISAAKDLGAEVEVVQSPLGLSRIGDSEAGRGLIKTLVLVLKLIPTCIAGIRLALRLRSAIRRFNPVIVHSHGIKTHLLTRIAVPRRIPTIWHVHDFFGQRLLARHLLSWFGGRVQLAIAISNAVAADVAKILPRVQVRTLLNAIDLNRFSPGTGDGEKLDEVAGLPAAATGTIRVGLIATYARWKGQMVLLDAAAKLANIAPELPLRWYVIGGSIYQTKAQFTESELRAASAERGLSERVGFVGFTADTPVIYRSLDIVVHASTLPEPFGLTIAEAMACGRPVVVSAAGGATELFENGQDAIGFTPGSATELASAIQRLVDDPELRLRLGKAARAVAEVRFDAGRYGAQLIECYHSLKSRI